ncbi:39S ribosomal protein L48, mitochondrial, partial [Armadillidium vulgare]
DNKFEKPSYPFLNVQVKGYDYTILERYARWVHSTAVHMDIDVEEWSIAELSSTMAPIFIQVIKAALPEGVKLSIHEHMEEHYNVRRIPDLQLKALESKLDELGGPVEKKK